MPVTIDKFEYATDALARAAWVPEVAVTYTGGTATADSASDAAHLAAYGIDGVLTNQWNSTNTAFPHWLKCDWGAGVARIVDQILLTKNNVSSNGSLIKDFVFAGSNNDSTWTTLYSGTAANGIDGAQEAFTFVNTTAYRYYKITITSNYWSGVSHSGFKELAMGLSAITVVTEATIKHAGDYAVKLVAQVTASLNKTVTRTVSPTINLTDQDNLKIWVRASRTGTNFKIAIHDSGGTTTESNIAITSADTWEQKTIDVSAVTNANKDAIDSLILTITNADAENTIYLDEWLGYSDGEGTGGSGGVSKSRIIGGV